MNRDSFIFYLSFYESISALPGEYQLGVFHAICKYAFFGDEAEMDGVTRAIFTLIKPQIDANNFGTLDN